MAVPPTADSAPVAGARQAKPSRSAQRLAEEWRPGEDEAPRQFARLADADALAGVDLDRRRAVVDDAKRLAVEAHAVVRARHAERLAQPPGSGAEQAQRGH